MLASFRTAIFVVLCLAARAAEQCSSASEIAADSVYRTFESRVRFDDVTAEWTFFKAASESIGTRSDAGVKHLGETLRNRRLVFMGDSTARNPAITLAALLCNRAFYPNCRQVASANANDGNTTAWMCRTPMSGEEASLFGRNAHNTCEATVRSFVVPLINMTLPDMPTLALRKKLWPTGKLPPMNRIVVAALNLTVDIVEAGCGPSDSVGGVMETLLKARGRSQEDRSRVTSMFPDAAPASKAAVLNELDAADSRPLSDDRPFFAQYDAVVVASGLHCTAKRWSRGWWYHNLATTALPRVARLAPVVFVEITHCHKRNAGRLLSCGQLAPHIGAMRQAFTRVPGVYVAPTRNLTARSGFAPGVHGAMLVTHPVSPDERRAVNCPFVDFVHPGLHCGGAVAYSVAMAVSAAIEDSKRFRAAHPECFVAPPTDATASAAPAQSPSGSREQDPPTEESTVAVPPATTAASDAVLTTQAAGVDAPAASAANLALRDRTETVGDGTPGRRAAQGAMDIPEWTWFVCGFV
eukprot:CAMPEP_0174861388 /NCGR_PEP_ID=MMETSP1114-20130205/51464_1 /TAXON_ID=312471 /ORGANISM="Neobodo designis, Strain CCAP 1951/1" /LENGTH=524 /DNA_ID=CAMNT_0016096399 /DNA_START=48 /DNA_END=1618 /DNA_ORIENTATION=+